MARNREPIEIPADAKLVSVGKSTDLAIWPSMWEGESRISMMRVNNYGQDNQFVRAGVASLNEEAFEALLEVGAAAFDEATETDGDEPEPKQEQVAEAPRAKRTTQRRGRPASSR